MWNTWVMIGIPSFVGIIGFVLGQYFKRWVDRGRAIVTVEGVKVDVDLAELITLPVTVVLMSEENPWLTDLNERISGTKLASVISRVEFLRGRVDEALRRVEESLTNLSRVAAMGKSEKQEFIEYFTLPIVDGILVGSLVREEISFDPVDYSSEPESIIVSPNTKVGGFDIHLGPRTYKFYHKNSSYDQFLRPAADAFAYFDVQRIQKMLQHVRKELIAAPKHFAEITEMLTSVVQPARRLFASLQFINQGRSPYVISPWAAIRLFKSGDFNGTVLILRKSGKEAASTSKPAEPAENDHDPPPVRTIPPGDAITVSYRSKLSVDEILVNHPLLLEFVNSGAVDCRVTVQLVTSSWWEKEFCRSPLASVGIRELTEKEEEDLLKRGQKLARK